MTSQYRHRRKRLYCIVLYCIHRFEKIGIDSSIPTGNEQSHVFFNSAARQIWSISAKIYMKRSVSHQIKRKLFTETTQQRSIKQYPLYSSNTGARIIRALITIIEKKTGLSRGDLFFPLLFWFIFLGRKLAQRRNSLPMRRKWRALSE